MPNLSLHAPWAQCFGPALARSRQGLPASITGLLVSGGLLLALVAAPVSADPPKPFTPAPVVEPLPELAPQITPSVPPADSPSTRQPTGAPPTPQPTGVSDDAPDQPGQMPAPDHQADNPDESPEESPDESPDADDSRVDNEQREFALSLEQLRTFAEVFGRIKSDYVEPIDDQSLLAAAIRGMLAGLDPHSAYLDADEYTDLQVGTKGEFGGLGIEVGVEDGFVKVIAPIDDTPAARAGIRAGDLIVRIDDKPVKGIDLSDAVKLMRGEPGTSIELTIMRDGEDKPLKISIERDIIQVASVKGRLLDSGFLYIRIANFQSRTTEDMLRQIEKLRFASTDSDAKANGSDDAALSVQEVTALSGDSSVPAITQTTVIPIKGLVLDLRNNPGGVLNSAVGVSDAFLRGGLIVYTQGRVDDARMEFKAGAGDIIDGAPMVVLVNGGSASASEIVAGALQDQGRAIIMGSDTFGKGSVQTIVPVDDSTALKLTTARYYTPSGRSIQAHGIEPDIRLERGNLTLADEPAVTPLKEANLMRHLEDSIVDVRNGKEKSIEQPLAAQDYQLSEALNVLKALSLSRSRSASKSEIFAPPERD